MICRKALSARLTDTKPWGTGHAVLATEKSDSGAFYCH